MTVPVPGFLVRHPTGTLLFDTGVACGATADPVGVLGKRVAANITMAGAANENVLHQLGAQGLVPDDVTHVACSHLHFDRCGCNRYFPRAKILLQRSKMLAARESGSPYDPRLWDLALGYRLIDGEHDVFADGTVLLFPTPGHTAGHQSAIVHASRAHLFVLAADACYTEEHLKRDIVPTLHWHEGAMRESMARLRRLREQAGTEVFFGHDQAQWEQAEGARGALV